MDTEEPQLSFLILWLLHQFTLQMEITEGLCEPMSYAQFKMPFTTGSLTSTPPPFIPPSSPPLYHTSLYLKLVPFKRGDHTNSKCQDENN